MNRAAESTRATMRILMIAPHPFYQERGTPIAVRSTATALVEAGHEVHILTFHEGEPWSIDGCTVERIPAIPGVRGIRPGFSFKKLLCDIFLFGASWRRVRAQRFDLLHGVEEGGFIAWVIGGVHSIPFVYDMDSAMSRQLAERWKWLDVLAAPMAGMEGRMMRASVGVLTVCEALEEHARSLAPDVLLGRVEDQSLLGSDRSEPPVDDIPHEWRDVVIYVGNLEPYQGIDLLLEGFLLASEIRPRLKLVVVGGVEARVLAYRERAAMGGYTDVVRFLGPRPTDCLGSYLRRATIIASPRLTGVNTPMKIYSYMDAGTAILATDLPTHTQVLDDTTAMLVEPTPRGVADGLLTLTDDPDLRRRLGETARVRYVADYGPDAFARKLGAFYEAVLASLGPERSAA